MHSVAQTPSRNNGTATTLSDPAEVVRGLSLMLRPGQVTELRILDGTTAADRYPQTWSGYYSDPERLAQDLALFRAWKAAYFVPNVVNVALLSRAANRVRPAKKSPTTSDGDIARRQWLLIDADPDRPADISSSDDEHQAAIERAEAIARDLAFDGWYAPIFADSGNGAHLMYPIDLPADDGGRVQRCLESLAKRYSDDVVKIDTTVFNPARIWKLYGTLSCKGDDTPDRPHRMARIISAPDVLEPIPLELLEELAGPAQPPPTSKKNGNRINGHSFDLAEWIRRNGLDVEGPEPWTPKGGGVGKRWVFRKCPMNADHTNRSAFILQFPSGAIEAGCHHNGCKGWDWHSLRNLVEPGWDQKKQKSTSATSTEPEVAENCIQPVLVRASDVDAKPINWLWKGKFALGKINLLAGDPGVNKSTVTIDFGSRVSTGTPWPDGSPCQKGSAIIMSLEDDLADTVRPRLDAAGADVSKIIFLEGVSLPDVNGGRRVKSVTLEHVEVIRQAILAAGDCKVLVIDPVSACIAKNDGHKNDEIRALLAPLAKVAAEHGVCVILVTHLNKGAGGKAMYRAMGTLAWVAAARSAWLVAKDRQHPRRRLFLPIKNNLGDDSTGWAFTVEGEDVPRICWEHQPIRMRADEALAEPQEDEEERRPGPEPQARTAAEEWLRDLLADGPMESDKIKAEGKAAGMSWSGAIRRAQQSIGIKPYRDQFTKAWTWKLPPERAQDLLAQVGPTHAQPAQPAQLAQPAQHPLITQKIGVKTPYDVRVDPTCAGEQVVQDGEDILSDFGFEEGEL